MTFKIFTRDDLARFVHRNGVYRRVGKYSFFKRFLSIFIIKDYFNFSSFIHKSHSAHKKGPITIEMRPYLFFRSSIVVLFFKDFGFRKMLVQIFNQLLLLVSRCGFSKYFFYIKARHDVIIVGLYIHADLLTQIIIA